MDDEGLMRRALAEAEHAASHGDVPVGALVVVEGEVIAARHNERQLTTDPTAHAEILAMRDACEHLGTWRLDNATLVTTLEPCVMCAGALGSVYNFGADPRLRHNFEISHNVLGDECAQRLKAFFASLRDR